jgi:hypothetical protein
MRDHSYYCVVVAALHFRFTNPQRQVVSRSVLALDHHPPAAYRFDSGYVAPVELSVLRPPLDAVIV